jgi:predicted XRE-type DNA-binding protein
VNTTDQNALAIAVKAVQIYAEAHPRPSSVTQKQAAEMLGVCHVTVSKLIRAGQIHLNRLGQVPISEVDKVLAARAP